MSSIRSLVGKNVAHYRKLKKLTQGELAKRVSVSNQTISNIEVGRQWISDTLAGEIAEVLGVDDVLLFSSAVPPKPFVIEHSPLDCAKTIRNLKKDWKTGKLNSKLSVQFLMELLTADEKDEK